jgi:hypothetical protein
MTDREDVMHKLTVAIAAVLVLTCGIAVAKKKGEFFIQGAKLTQQSDGSWSGPGRLDGVKGKVTISGKIDPVADAVEFGSKEHRSRHQWTWVAGKRRVTGCAIIQILKRPNGVLLWGDGGRITKTSLKEREYQGRYVALYGPTKSSDPTHALISIRELDLARPGPPPTKCR